MNTFTAVVCKCRSCSKRYYEHQSRADYKGYCSAKCLHKKAKECGYTKQRFVTVIPRTEYDVLKSHNQVGSVVLETLSFPMSNGKRLPLP